MSDNPFDLVPSVLRAALLRQGFEGLTAVQAAVLAEELVGRDLRITSQTGSGKTVALGLVLARNWAETPPSGQVEALVITPTRELASQVQRELSWLLADVPGTDVAVVTGGTSVGRERRELGHRPRVVVATPGRLHDHLRGEAFDPSGVAQVVLDEADQMLDMGFRDDLEAILQRLPATRRTHMVSATFAHDVRRLADTYQTNAVLVQGTALGAANRDIEHVAHMVAMPHRYDVLFNVLLLWAGQRALVFVRTRADTARLAAQLEADGIAAQDLSGDLPQAQRTRTLESFRNGRIDVLVATDVAARGLDIPDVAVVIHGDLPTDGENYTHRSGRTGRAGRKGHSVALVPPFAQRRLTAMLAAAGIDVAWQPAPTAAQVRKASVKRMRASLYAALEQDPPHDQLVYAEKLLGEHDPKKLVATLLEQAAPELPAEPRELAPQPTPRLGWDDGPSRDRRPAGPGFRGRPREGVEPSGPGHRIPAAGPGHRVGGHGAPRFPRPGGPPPRRR